MPPATFEPAIPVSERPHTHDLDRTATGIGVQTIYYPLFARGQWRVLVPVFRDYRIHVLKYVLNPTSGCYTQALAQKTTPSILGAMNQMKQMLPSCSLPVV